MGQDRLPVLTAKQVIMVLERLGFKLTQQQNNTRIKCTDIKILRLQKMADAL